MTLLKTVKVSDLIINTENYRYEPTVSQREAIDKMIEEQGENLLNLTEHILTYGLNPNDKIQVVESINDKGKYIVLEGNRRAVALKLLNSPSLIEGAKTIGLKKKFKKLNDDNKDKLIDQVECILYDSPDEADIWIGIKHGYGKNGVGTDSWGPLQKQRFGEKTEGKTTTSIQVINFVKQSEYISKEIKSNIENISTTNLDRLINDPDIRDFLGVYMEDGILNIEVEEEEVAKGISHIVKDIMNPNFTVKNIYNKDDRKVYIKNFPKDSIPDKNKRIVSKPLDNKKTSSPSPQPPSPKPKPNPVDRDLLIPRTCHLKINNPKVNAIYHELQKLSLAKFTTVAAVSFRVFVEHSMDIFIEENKLTKTKDGRDLNKDSTLKTKVIEVAEFLENNKLADKHICKGIKSAANNANDLLGVETLHAYVHNSSFSPIAKNLVISWDNIQKFIEKVWENIK